MRVLSSFNEVFLLVSVKIRPIVDNTEKLVIIRFLFRFFQILVTNRRKVEIVTFHPHSIDIGAYFQEIGS